LETERGGRGGELRRAAVIDISAYTDKKRPEIPKERKRSKTSNELLESILGQLDLKKKRGGGHNRWARKSSARKKELRKGRCLKSVGVGW